MHSPCTYQLFPPRYYARPTFCFLVPCSLMLPVRYLKGKCSFDCCYYDSYLYFCIWRRDAVAFLEREYMPRSLHRLRSFVKSRTARFIRYWIHPWLRASLLYYYLESSACLSTKINLLLPNELTSNEAIGQVHSPSFFNVPPAAFARHRML